MTRRRWIADSWDQATASLKGEQAAHLIRVLRARTGMEFDVVAGDRVWRSAVASLRAIPSTSLCWQRSKQIRHCR